MDTFVMDVERLEELFQISPNGLPKEVKDKKKAAIEESVRTLLTNVGEDPDREGLQRTPDRVARMYDELLSGYHTDPVKMINDAPLSLACSYLK